MGRLFLACFLAVAIAATAAPAYADSTTTQSVAPGGTLRSSADAEPTPANPVIVTVTTAGAFANGAPGTCMVNCSDGPSTISIDLKDKRDRANGPGLEGPSGYDFIGPQIDVTSSQQMNIESISYEVDGSVALPDFAAKGQSQFFHALFRPGTFDGQPVELKQEALPNGDYRLTQGDNQFIAPGSFDLLQQSFYAHGYAIDDSLPEALKKGVEVWIKTNYRCSAKVKVTVSKPVAKKLKLRSTTIGSKTIKEHCGVETRVPLTKAAKKALKKYKKVLASVESVITGPNGQVIKGKKKATLKRPDSELE